MFPFRFLTRSGTKEGEEGAIVVEGLEITIEALRPPHHWVNVLSMRQVGPDELLENGETSELRDCPGSNFDFSNVHRDPTGKPLIGECFVCAKEFTQAGSGAPIEPIDATINSIAASVLDAKIAP